MSCPIDAIFVPKGAEFKAVQRGLRRRASTVALYAIPMGPQAVKDYLEQWKQTKSKQWEQAPSILLMGLCGSLSPNLEIGDRVLYQSCIDAQTVGSVPLLNCDAALLQTVQERIGNSVTVVTAVMCDRMIHRASDKQTLAERYGTQVVDMEGYAVLEVLQSMGASVGMLRVVSDDVQHDLPDLSAAMTETGELNPAALATRMMREPLKAFRLIQGSLTGLKQLENVTAQLAL